MAVRVISEKPVKTRKTICSNCGYELEFTNADIQSRTVSCMGDMDTENYILCPSPACAAKSYKHKVRSYD